MNNQESEAQHLPVMAEQVVERLVTNTRGAYLDLTAGSGGHLKALAQKLESAACLHGVDIDPAAIDRARKFLAGIDQNLKLVQSDFARPADLSGQWSEEKFDGILLDLGMSSPQVDDPERGISFKYDGPLDMRFDPEGRVTAEELVNSLSQKELTRIIFKYGEERRAARIATAIVKERQRGHISSTFRLKETVLTAVSPSHRKKALARVFQAFRIAVNNELEKIKSVLPTAVSLLKPGGRLAVISYHSLEDRIVKQFFKSLSGNVCTCPPELPICVCGKVATLKLLTRRVVVPAEDEIESNPRSRSARLRVVEKLP